MMLKLYNQFDGALARIPEAAALLFVRVVAAQPFWSSGLTKIDGFGLSESAVDLFRYEYDLPLIAPEIAAPMAAIAEIVLPILLVAGLFTRFAALGLFIMTMIIQFLVYPDAWWPVHSLWAALLAVIIVRGGGDWSLDRFLLNRDSEA